MWLKSGSFLISRHGSIQVSVEAITHDGLKCQTRTDNNKEYCGKVYKEGLGYFLTNKTGNKAVASFTVK